MSRTFATFLACALVACSGDTTGDTTGECEPTVCPEGGVLAAEVSEQTLPTCGDVEQRYADVVVAGSPCSCDADCVVLNGSCGEGLGGCYEPGGACASQALLTELGGLYASHSGGCVDGVCDCDVPPEVFCNDAGACELVAE